MKENQDILVLEHINKAFPGVKAVDDVSLTVREGEIHALLGHNGAGKSTLVKIISGAYQKDSGRMLLDGKELKLSSPADGLNEGICMVYQELDLIPYLDGNENIFLGQERFLNKFGLINRKQRHEAAQELVTRLGVDINLDVPVRNLSISKQQLIAITKALSHNARIMVFDEPTAALTESEANKLFDIMRLLTKQGMGIIWITHRLDEVFRMADRVTLMRDGKWLSTNDLENVKMTDIVEAMTGEKEDEQQSVKHNAAQEGPCRISCRNLSLDKVYQDISFDLHAGEVLGITGLIGCGATEIAKSLFAVLHPQSGEIHVNGKRMRRYTPHAAVRNGIAYISEDRKGDGLNLIGSVRSNISITILKKLSRFGFINFSKEAEAAAEMIERLAIRVAGPMQTAGTLSGGNQQKIVIAKWLLKEAGVFIMCEPTRGIDVGVKREIHKMIRSLAKSGIAVLVVSTEIEEIIETCDRILILYEGRVNAELLSG